MIINTFRQLATHRNRGTTATLAILVLAFTLLASCGDSGDDAGTEVSPGEEAAAAALEEDRVVIDVRTPQEYEAGHVTDATLIDIQGPDFAELVSALDPGGEYVVYCRSGNRSAAAAAQMREIDLDVLDGGGLDDMEAAGWPVTR